MVRLTRRSKGCESCRAKKVKCDESQPSCLRCQKAGRACQGAIQGSIFIIEQLPVVQMRRTAGRMSEDIHSQASQPMCSHIEDAWQLPGSKPDISGNERQLSQQHFSCEGRALDLKGLNEEIEHRNSSLVRSPGHERADPFATLARRTTARENILIALYISDILPIFGGGSSAPLNPPRDACFSVNITGVASMETMFLFTARFLSTKRGHRDIEAKQYNVRAFRRINEAIADPTLRFHNSTIMAVMGCLHDLYQMRGSSLLAEEEQEINSHIEGIRYLIKGRGGFAMVCKDSSLSWMLIATDLISHGRISADWTPLSEHAVLSANSMISSSVNGTNPYMGTYISGNGLLVAEYVGAFRNFSLEAQTRKQKYVSESPVDIGSSWITRTFRPGGTIQHLLTNLNAVSIPRIFVLFICNIILWDYRQDLNSLFADYFKRVLISIDKQRMDLVGSIDLLFWTLTTDPETLLFDTPERLWFLGRLLRIHGRLSKHLQFQLESALLQFLELEGEIFRTPLDPEEFVAAIWSDLESTN